MAKKGNTVPITPSVLKWAMAEAGLTVDALAAKTKVPASEIRGWLADGQKPTLTKFRRLASALARIPSVFLLPAPPPSGAPDVEFRHPPGGRASLNPSERRYIREARRIQEAAARLTRNLGDVLPPLPHVHVGTTNVEDAAGQARQRLTDSNGSFGREWQNESQAFQGWRDVLERSGVLVFVLPLGKESCRGFSLADDHAPLVAVNSAWRQSARIFTLFHEYGHLLTRTSSACVEETGGRAPHLEREKTATLPRSDDADERWCEQFAAALLMPEGAVLQFLHNDLQWPPHHPATLAIAQRVASHFRVSLRAATLRLIGLRAAGWDLYREIPPTSDAKAKGGAGPGRDRGQMREDQFGARTVSLFVRGLQRDVIGRADVLEYLDVSDTHLERFERAG